MRTAIALISVAVLLAGCLPQSSRSHLPQAPDLYDWQIVDGYEPGASCACAKARQKYLRNLRDHTRTVGVHASETNIFSNTTVDRALPDQTVGADGKRFIGCSVLSVESDCDTTVTYRVTRLADGQQHLLKSKSGVQSFSSFVAARQAKPLSPALNCKKECIGGPSPGPRCVVADNTAFGHDSSAHSLLAAVGAIGPDGLATRADLLKAWGKSEADEPCGRGDIVAKGGAVSNFGARCEFAGAFAGPGSSVTITLPEGVVGRYARNANGFSIAFPNPELAPLVRFESPWLDQDFGGATNKIEKSGGHFIVSQPRGCLALKL